MRGVIELLISGAQQSVITFLSLTTDLLYCDAKPSLPAWILNSWEKTLNSLHSALNSLNQRDLTWVSSSFDLSFKKYHLFEDQLGHRIGCATKAHIKRQTIVSEMLRIVEGTVTSSHKICIVDQHSQTPTLHSLSVNKLGWRERKKESERGRERAREGRGREVAERESEN